jgi:hypothetical protein
LLSFPRKRESSILRVFWTPAAVYPRGGGDGSDGSIVFFSNLLILAEKEISVRDDVD